MTADEKHHRTIRSFVRRAGRMTASQERALEMLWPEYGVEYTAEEPRSSSTGSRSTSPISI